MDELRKDLNLVSNHSPASILKNVIYTVLMMMIMMMIIIIIIVIIIVIIAYL